MSKSKVMEMHNVGIVVESLDNVINNLTFLNDSAAFETQVQNLGNIHQLGMQFLGSLKFGPLTISQCFA
jgi:hypothetical protein